MRWFLEGQSLDSITSSTQPKACVSGRGPPAAYARARRSRRSGSALANTAAFGKRAWFHERSLQAVCRHQCERAKVQSAKTHVDETSRRRKPVRPLPTFNTNTQNSAQIITQNNSQSHKSRPTITLHNAFRAFIDGRRVHDRDGSESGCGVRGLHSRRRVARISLDYSQ
jgi:hypothetical protein